MRHTYWVRQIGKNFILNSKQIKNNFDLDRLEALCLLHDTGRFYKINSVGKLVDNWDHAIIGYNILKQDKTYNKQSKLLLWVKYHNAISNLAMKKDKLFIDLKKDGRKKALFYLKFIKDIDKLQNFSRNNFISDLDEVMLSMSKKTWEYTKSNLKDLLNWKILSSKKQNTLIDRYLFILGRINDLNFDFSINYVKNINFLSKIMIKLNKLNFEEIELVEKYFNKEYGL